MTDYLCVNVAFLSLRLRRDEAHGSLPSSSHPSVSVSKQHAHPTFEYRFISILIDVPFICFHCFAVFPPPSGPGPGADLDRSRTREHEADKLFPNFHPAAPLGGRPRFFVWAVKVLDVMGKERLNPMSRFPSFTSARAID